MKNKLRKAGVVLGFICLGWLCICGVQVFAWRFMHPELTETQLFVWMMKRMFFIG